MKVLVPLLFCLWLCMVPVLAQTINIRGLVKDNGNGAAIPFSYAVNKASGRGTVANDAGVFLLAASPGDSILVSSLGYLPVKVKVPNAYAPNDTLKIKLFPKPVALRELVVRPFGLSEKEKKNYERIINYTKPGIESPISALYYTFSREGKSREKLRQLLERELYEEKYYNRLIPFLQYRQVNLASFDLRAFTRYCPLTEDFLNSANNYEFYFAVSRCFDSFYGNLPSR